MKEFLKQWWITGLIILVGGFLLVTGMIFEFLPSVQVLTKKLFLLGLWYGLSYYVRVARIGHINWEDEKDKKLYYFVFLICSALIIALA